MKKEVEMKCYITEKNKARIQKYLDTYTTYKAKADKKDTLFCTPGKKNIEFRLRKETLNTSGTVYTVTRKKREYSNNGVEINTEHEFEIHDISGFCDFMSTLGYDIFYTKEKKTIQYTQSEILFEVVSISNLGEFLEIEILSEEKEVNKNQQKIFEIFKEVDLVDDIEKKPYGMLMGKIELSE